MAPRLTLISPDFTRLWFGQAVSSLGDMVFSTTLMLWVATVLAGEETWAPAAVSGVLVAGARPCWSWARSRASSSTAGTSGASCSVPRCCVGCWWRC